MTLTAAQAIARAQRTFPEMDGTVALDHLNDEWAELASAYNLRDDELWQALAAEDGEITLADTIAKIQKVHLYTGANTSKPLRLLNETEMDLYSPSLRVGDSGTPIYYNLGSEISSNTGVRTMGLIPKPDTSTLVVSGATNANPIVITTTTAHGLVDGDLVRPVNVGGNTNANTLGYAKVTGYSTTTFGLYSDSALTTGVAGNSGYTSGGSVVCGGSPALRIFLQRASTFITSDNLPNIGPNADLFVFGITWRYAREIRDTELMAREKALYDLAAQKFEAYRSNMGEGKGVQILPFHFRPRRII